MKKLFLLLALFILAISCSNSNKEEVSTQTDSSSENLNSQETNAVEIIDAVKLTPASTIFEGDFAYYADSATFSNYNEVKIYPVAMEGEYINLEKEYTSFAFAEPTKVNLKVEGYLEERAGMEEGTTNQFLIITKIIGFDTNNTKPLF